MSSSRIPVSEVVTSVVSEEVRLDRGTSKGASYRVCWPVTSVLLIASPTALAVL